MRPGKKESQLLAIEVVLALPSRQALISLRVEPGTTVETALGESGIGDKFPDQDLAKFQAGIWGKPVGREHVLKDGDRLELYRPLLIDPRVARRQLAQSGESMGRRRERTRDPD